jgi:hypothetical protein
MSTCSVANKNKWKLHKLSLSDVSKNAGEWAELYVLLNTLAEGKLFAADGNLNKLKDNYFPVISIEMQQDDQPTNNPVPIQYLIDSKDQTITITSNGQSSLVNMGEFKSEASAFFQIISSRKGNGSFKVPEALGILNKLNNPKTKQSSSKKADIHIVIHDIMTGFENEVGFSIKSKHSSSATLINASGQTLFQYLIKSTSDPREINDIKTALSTTKLDGSGCTIKVGPKERVSNLINAGFELEFKAIKSQYFQENIQLIDSSLDVFLAECLKVFMQEKITGLADIVSEVSLRNPCKYKVSCKERLLDFYQYKMKRLIVDAALGMQPKTPWTGEYDASGGYIIVKESGDVICYHLYNWNALQDYLYNNLRFETPPSTSTGSKRSFNYALHYSDGMEQLMDICLQIRFQ